MNRLPLFGLLVLTLSLSFYGCNVISDTKIDEGVVIAKTAMLKSSTAKVSLNVKELKKGDRLDILEQAEIKTPTGAIQNWVKVKLTPSGDTGWLESRYVINKTYLDKTNELFDKSRELPAQGLGRVKVSANLRLEPGGEVLTSLNRGTNVEIVGRIRTIQKQEDTDSNPNNDEGDAKTVLWYQVRLSEGEVLRAGWLGAAQVELDVPDDVLHLEGDGRRFTGWVVFDQTKTKKGEIKNNYIALMKRVDGEAAVDFTRIWFLNYSPDLGRYINGYLIDGVRGVLPVKLGTAAGGKGFMTQELDENARPVSISYEVKRVSAEKVEVKRLQPLLPQKRTPKIKK
ncbi:MAG: hypothetical protein AB1757_11520 [Acidobacteriota bacterium]